MVIGRNLEDFPDQERTRAQVVLITRAGEEGDLIMEVGEEEGVVKQALGSKVAQGW